MSSKRKTIKRSAKRQKICYFCQENREPLFSDAGVIKRFLTERNKIISRERTGTCAKHQRALAKSIKYARHLALLPFTA